MSTALKFAHRAIMTDIDVGRGRTLVFLRPPPPRPGLDPPKKPVCGGGNPKIHGN